MAKANTKNGTSAKASLASETRDDADTDAIAGIVISDEERASISELETEALRLKVSLADLDMQLARLETTRHELRLKVGESSKAYIDAVVAAAGAHGIDLNDKAVRWNFDTQKMTFTRQNS